MRILPRLSMEAVLVLSLAIACIALLFTDRPRDARAVKIERGDTLVVTQDGRLGVTVNETGLRQ